jgi:hypothetical protein
VGNVARHGFETAMGTPSTARFAAVQALDAAGNVIGQSAAVGLR